MKSTIILTLVAWPACPSAAAASRASWSCRWRERSHTAAASGRGRVCSTSRPSSRPRDFPNGRAGPRSRRTGRFTSRASRPTTASCPAGITLARRKCWESPPTMDAKIAAKSCVTPKYQSPALPSELEVVIAAEGQQRSKLCGAGRFRLDPKGWTWKSTLRADCIGRCDHNGQTPFLAAINLKAVA